MAADHGDFDECGKLFAGEAEFFWAAASFDGLPPAEGPGDRLRRPLGARQAELVNR